MEDSEIQTLCDKIYKRHRRALEILFEFQPDRDSEIKEYVVAELIRKIANLPESELLTQISILKDAELLYERGIYPQISYVFRHALTREVVYDSLLTQKRKALHEAIGEAIEKLYGDHLGEYGDILTEHFIRGENFAKGADYANRAGKGARGKSAYKDAIHYATQEVSCLERLPKSETNLQRIIEARTRARVWEMSMDKAQFAGGARKNRRQVETVTLPAGDYEATFVTDDSHSPADWNAAPPCDPLRYGLILAVTVFGDLPRLLRR